MSHFSETLKALMALSDPPLTGLALAARAGISSSTISRVLSDQQVATAEHVGQLCAVISDDRERRVELLLSYLRDVVKASAMAGIDERHVVLNSANDEACAVKSLGADLELLAEECAKHEDVRAIVSDLVRMVMRHRAEVIDTAANVYPFAGGKSALVAEDAQPVNAAGVALEVLKGKAAQAAPPPAGKASPAPRK